MPHLLIIDPQNDFCDYPDSALPVQGARADLERLVALIERKGKKIDEITISLDSHHTYDIAHPIFWVDEKGLPVKPFTEITYESFVDKGIYTPSQFHILKPYGWGWVADYLKALKEKGKTHMVWPAHCIVGTWGHQIFKPLQEVLQKWEEEACIPVNYVFKGLNPYTEHFSALRAEVVDPMDPSTGYNLELIRKLETADEVWVGGEASSHCVLETLKDINKTITHIRKVKVLQDCMSPVQGFDAVCKTFYDGKNPLELSTEV